jgi:hypothetical protein
LKNDKYTIYIKKLIKIIDTGNSDFKDNEEEQEEVIKSIVPNNILQFILLQRENISLNNNEDIETVFSNKNISINVLNKFFEMSNYFENNGLKSFSIFPVSTINRKFSYIDQRVLSSLLKQKGLEDKSIKDVFQIDSDKWRKIGNEIITQKRKNRKKYNKRFRNKLITFGTIPKGSVIKSISTDGVAISITCYTPPDKINNKKYNYTGKEHIIAFDDGRVNLFQSAQKDNNGDFQTTRLVGTEYQIKSKIIKRVEWEESYKVMHPELKDSITNMSLKSWKTCNFENFIDMVRTYRTNYNTFQTHYIDNKDFSRWKMLLWRKKISIMAQRYSHTIRKCNIHKNKKETLVMGIGNGKFGSTGQKYLERVRHGGVPTSSKHNILIRTLKSMRLKFRIQNINEYNTTQCCFKCHNKMNNHYDAEGKIFRGLKDCINCKEGKNPFKSRNRDLNAAKNIWLVCFNIINGLVRPDYLKPPEKKAVKVKHKL